MLNFNGTPAVCAAIAPTVQVVPYNVYAPPNLFVSEKLIFSFASLDISGIKSYCDNPPSCTE